MELLGGARQCAGCHYHDYDGCEEEVDIESYKEARKGDLADYMLSIIS